MSSADVVQSPNAGNHSIFQKRLLLEVLGGDTAQVLRMLKQAAHKEASQARRCNSANDADGEMDKLVAGVSSSSLWCQHARKPPRMGSRSARLWASEI